MAVKLISKKKNKYKVIAPLVHKCWSVSLFIWASISQPHSACKPIFKVYRRLWPTRLACCGPLMGHGLPVENHWSRQMVAMVTENPDYKVLYSTS